MRKELDEKLVKDFPLLYKDRYADMRSTCMCWGFDCGDGWEPLIRSLSEKLEPLIQKLIDENKEKYPKIIEDHPRASQVKEKFGTLRFYMMTSTDEMEDIIGEYERMSENICEFCGASGHETNH